MPIDPSALLNLWSLKSYLLATRAWNTRVPSLEVELEMKG